MDDIYNQVKKYYTDKIEAFGTTPKGVDWNSQESQFLRFSILSKLIANNDEFHVLDYGCGFGSLFEYYLTQYSNFKYTGFDISETMIIEAKKKHLNANTNWLNHLEAKQYDYVIASGIFNVKLKNNNDDWLEYIFKTLTEINTLSKKGFAFNVLTKYSDKEYMKDYLFYADPLILFDYCKNNFSKKVSLLHDYPLYEFTIIVRK